jgi:hypothetical protein
MALGGGFSMGNAPSLGSVISGGTLAFGGMGSDAQGIVSNLINGLQLVRSITGLINGTSRPTDQAYQNSVNRGGSVCLNSFGAVAKWIPASVRPPSGLLAAH